MAPTARWNSRSHRSRPSSPWARGWPRTRAASRAGFSDARTARRQEKRLPAHGRGEKQFRPGPPPAQERRSLRRDGQDTPTGNDGGRARSRARWPGLPALAPLLPEAPGAPPPGDRRLRDATLLGLDQRQEYHRAAVDGRLHGRRRPRKRRPGRDGALRLQHRELADNGKGLPPAAGLSHALLPEPGRAADALAGTPRPRTHPIRRGTVELRQDRKTH